MKAQVQPLSWCPVLTVSRTRKTELRWHVQGRSEVLQLVSLDAELNHILEFHLIRTVNHILVILEDTRVDVCLCALVNVFYSVYLHVNAHAVLPQTQRERLESGGLRARCRIHREPASAGRPSCRPACNVPTQRHTPTTAGSHPSRRAWSISDWCCGRKTWLCCCHVGPKISRLQ